MHTRLNSFPVTAFSVVATCLVSFEPVCSQELAAEELWQLVVQSDVIVDGVPDVPVEQIGKANDSGKHEYVNLTVRVKKCIKGDHCPATILVRYYTRSDSPSARILAESNAKQSVLFLTQVDTQTITHAPEVYFAGHTPKAIQSSSQELIERLSAEVSAQKEIINDFARHFRPENEPAYARVRELVEATLNPRTEQKAFADLEAAGQSAVPALIMLMDDRRELPVKEMSLRNGPGGFEAFRHYGPKVVIDSITAILNQITGKDFGTTMNGGSERERKAAVDGWRVYLYRTRFGQQDPASPSGA